jgi:hypothetical protein
MAVDEKIAQELTAANMRTSLCIPDELRLVRVDVEDYVDYEGNNALRVWIVLGDDVDEQDLPIDALIELKNAIHDRLLEVGEARFPYIFVTKESAPREASGEE